MHREDFWKLVGAAKGSEDILPVALLLDSGYACAGLFSATANEGLTDTCVLVNAQLMELRTEGRASGRPAITDFNEFLEEIAVHRTGGDGAAESPQGELYGKRIPLTAIPFDQIAVLYPVAHIGALLDRLETKDRQLPRFLDFEQSEVVKLLRTKLW